MEEKEMKATTGIPGITQIPAFDKEVYKPGSFVEIEFSGDSKRPFPKSWYFKGVVLGVSSFDIRVIGIRYLIDSENNNIHTIDREECNIYLKDVLADKVRITLVEG